MRADFVCPLCAQVARTVPDAVMSDDGDAYHDFVIQLAHQREFDAQEHEWRPFGAEAFDRHIAARCAHWWAAAID